MHFQPTSTRLGPLVALLGAGCVLPASAPLDQDKEASLELACGASGQVCCLRGERCHDEADVCLLDEQRFQLFCTPATCEIEQGSTPGQLCDDGCVDVESNPDHCGICGRRCPEGPPTQTRACVDGQCQLLDDPGCGVLDGLCCVSRDTPCDGNLRCSIYNTCVLPECFTSVFLPCDEEGEACCAQYRTGREPLTCVPNAAGQLQCLGGLGEH